MDIAGEITSRGTGAITEPAPRGRRGRRRLRDAGAIVIGKTTMPELGLWPFTESITWGVTRNPWDTDRTPGGSSGGSAAAVAAGLVPAAVAADGAGSIRIPAACCGLFGLKPHTGRVPRAPHDDDGSHWICFGGLTRSVADARLMYDVMAPRDRAARRAAPLRIAYSEALPAGAPRGKLDDRDARSALRDTADAAARPRPRGRRARHRLPRPRRAGDRRPDVPRRSATSCDEIEQPAAARAPHARTSRGRARWSRDRTVERLLDAERRIARAGRPRCGTTFDVLLMPMMAAPAVPGAGSWRAAARPPPTCGRAAGCRSACCGTRPASRPRRCPPGSLGDGLPLAVQLVGRPHGEGTLLDAFRRRSRMRARGYLTAPRRSLASVRRRMAGCRICSGELELKVQGNGAAP